MINMLVPTDRTLSFSAVGVLSTMLNLPECDYKTENDLLQFTGDTDVETKNALEELLEHGYIDVIDGKFAINKFRIPEMKLVCSSEPMTISLIDDSETQE